MNKDIRKTIFIFGSLCAVILLLFQLEKWSLLALGASKNLYIIISGISFLVLGILISRYFYFKTEVRRNAVKRSSLTDQEIRVLVHMADGLSNKEIAEQLFIAETTVKTHVSNILTKLDAKRSPEAIKIGKEIEII